MSAKPGDIIVEEHDPQKDPHLSKVMSPGGKAAGVIAGALPPNAVVEAHRRAGFIIWATLLSGFLAYCIWVIVSAYQARSSPPTSFSYESIPWQYPNLAICPNEGDWVSWVFIAAGYRRAKDTVYTGANDVTKFINAGGDPCLMVRTSAFRVNRHNQTWLIGLKLGFLAGDGIASTNNPKRIRLNYIIDEKYQAMKKKNGTFQFDDLYTQPNDYYVPYGGAFAANKSDLWTAVSYQSVVSVLPNSQKQLFKDAVVSYPSTIFSVPQFTNVSDMEFVRKNIFATKTKTNLALTYYCQVNPNGTDDVARRLDEAQEVEGEERQLETYVAEADKALYFEQGPRQLAKKTKTYFKLALFMDWSNATDKSAMSYVSFSLVDYKFNEAVDYADDSGNSHVELYQGWSSAYEPPTTFLSSDLGSAFYGGGYTSKMFSAGSSASFSGDDSSGGDDDASSSYMWSGSSSSWTSSTNTSTNTSDSSAYGPTPAPAGLSEYGPTPAPAGLNEYGPTPAPVTGRRLVQGVIEDAHQARINSVEAHREAAKGSVNVEEEAHRRAVKGSATVKEEGRRLATTVPTNSTLQYKILGGNYYLYMETLTGSGWQGGTITIKYKADTDGAAWTTAKVVTLKDGYAGITSMIKLGSASTYSSKMPCDSTLKRNTSSNFQLQYAEFQVRNDFWKTETLTEVDPVDWGTILGVLGGFWAYVGAIFSIIFVSTADDPIRMHSTLAKYMAKYNVCWVRQDEEEGGDNAPQGYEAKPHLLNTPKNEGPTSQPGAMV